MTKHDHIDLVSDPDDDKLDNMPKNESVPKEHQSEVEQLREELDQAKDRALRALADLENFRARAARQAADERKYASIDLMREMLPVWDNIGRALEAANQSHSLESLTEGVKMVHRQFIEVLAKFQCEKIETLHKPFDPNFQQSVAQIPSDEFSAGVVVAETLTGFKLHDRVVRPSQVVLSAGMQNTDSTNATENETAQRQ